MAGRVEHGPAGGAPAAYQGPGLSRSPGQPWAPPGGLVGGATQGGRGVWPLLAIALTRSHFSAKNCNHRGALAGEWLMDLPG